MTEQSQKNARKFHASLLGCGLLFGTLIATLCPTNLLWQTIEQIELFWFNGSFAGGLCILGLLGFLGCLFFPQSLLSTIQLHEKRVLIGATMCVILPQIYIGFSSNMPNNSWLSMAISGSVASIGIFGLGMLWFQVFRTDSTDHILFNTALSLVVATMVMFTFFFIPSLAIQMICAAVLVAVSSLLLYRAQSTPDSYKLIENFAINSSSPSSPSRPTISPASLGHAFSNLWLPLVGTMIAAFIQGLVWDPVLSESSRFSNLFGAFCATIAGACLVLLVVIASIKAKPGLGALPRFIQVGCPIAIAILLLHPFVAPTEGIAGGLSSIVGQGAFYATALFVWASAVASSDNALLPPLAFYFPCVAALALAYGIGLFLIHVIGLGGKDICLIMLTVFLVLYSFSLMQANQTEKHGRIIDEIRPDQFIHKRSDELAQEFGISPRETEVLYYLGRGYNHGYIARKLFLSENTVRTHVRHIYTKLGISSREDLLNLIDENEIETTHESHTAE